MRKKLLSVLLVLCMALSLLPTVALADEPEVPTTPEEVTTEPLENTQEPEQAAELPEEAVTYDAPQSTDQAEVNGTAYPTLAAALGMAGDGDTVTLLSDVTSPDEAVFYEIGKSITIDLNGFEWSGLTYGGNAKTNFITVKDDATLTIQDSSEGETGKISASYNASSSLSVVYVTEGATLVLSSGTITNGKANYGGMNINVEKGAAFTMDGGKVIGADSEASKRITCINVASNSAKSPTTITINGGSVVNEANATYDAVCLNNGAENASVDFKMTGGEIFQGCIGSSPGMYQTLTFAGGTANGTVRIPQFGTFHIEGGTFNGAVIYSSALTDTSSITGGKFTGTVTHKTGSNIVSGGAFVLDPSEYLAEGYHVKAIDEDGCRFRVTNEAAAKIGSQSFASLPEALDAAQNGQTIALCDDIDITKDHITVQNKRVTLDLAGHTIRAANTISGRITVLENGELTLKDSSDIEKNGKGQGKIFTEQDYVYDAIDTSVISVYGKFTMDSGYIYTVRPVNTVNNGHFGVGVYGSETTTATAIFNGGKIESGWYAIAGNGTYDNTLITINGGTYISTVDFAIYHPQVGTLNINGGTIDGGAGALSMNDGTVNIKGGALASYGTGDTGDWSDGTSGQKKAALNFNAEYGDVTANISGGYIKSTGDVDMIIAKPDKTSVSISGGYFSAEPDSSYVKSGYYVQPSDKDGYSYMVSDSAVAQIGTDKYGTLAEAVAAAEEGDTVKLLKNTTVSDMLITRTTMTLDLGKNTLTSTSNSYAVVAVNGILTVKNGTISITSETGVALYAQKATVIVDNGATILSNNTAVQVGNCIKNEPGVYWGKAIVNKGAYVEGDVGILVSGPYPVSSLSGDGTLSAEKDVRSVLTVTGGTIVGAAYGISGNGTYHGTEITISGGSVRQTGADGGALYHPQNGVLNISGAAVLEGASGIQLCSGEGVIANITGGSISATGEDLRADKTGDGFIPDGSALSVVNRNYPGGMPKMSVSGGYFSARHSASVLAYTWSGNKATEWEQANEYLTLSGGRFTSDPTAYLATDYLAVTEDYTTGGVTYKYAVQEKKTEVEVVVAPPNVAPLPENAKDEVKEAAAALETAPAPEGLETVANKVAQNTTLTSDSSSVKKALEEAKIEVSAEKPVTIVVEPYLNIEVKDCVKTGDSAQLELNITPMYNTVATTANVSEGDELVKEIPEGNDDPDLKVNAAVVGTPKPMTVTTPVTITIPLPDGFSVENLKVQHTKSNGSVYYYDATIEEGTPKTATFTVTHGFSKFVLKADARTATVTFKNGDSIVAENQVFSALNVGDKLPTASKSGYSFSGWTFEGIDGTYTTMTDKLLDALNGKDVTATAKFSANSSGGGGGGGSSVVTPPTGWKNPFTDVDENDWCYDAVKYAVENGLFNGTTDTTFSPNATMTRGMLVTVLYRLEGSPAVTAAPSFSDVAADSYCAKAVVWANANGIVKGFSEAVFAPGSNITREQMAAILYRYAQYKGMEAVTLEENLTSFPDADEISEYAVSAMNWAVGKRLITGKTDGTLSPKGNATRAQVATILMRYCETVAK